MKNPKDEVVIYVYVLELFSYGKHSHSKIGVSTNPEKRIISLRGEYGHCLEIYKTWKFSDRKEAFRIETIVKNNFEKWKLTEGLVAPPKEVSNYVSNIVEVNS